MSAPSKAKQQRIPFSRGDYITIGGEIADRFIVRPLLVLKNTPDETIEPYLSEIARLMNMTDEVTTQFRNQLTDLPRNCKVDVSYLQNHFNQVGKISVQADQKDRFFTLYFHRRKAWWDSEQPPSIPIGTIDANVPSPRSFLRHVLRPHRC